ncbi:MAG: hypothetical protein ALAOOOJD_04615 [bacterium]|nr:hypothetical protein [bacterium]
MHDERNAGIAECVDAGADGERSDDIQRGQAVLGITEFTGKIEFVAPRREFDHVGGIGDGFKSAVAFFGFNETGNVFINHRTAQPHRHDVDKQLALQNALEIGIIKNALGSRQTQRCAGDANMIRRSRRFSAGINLKAALQKIGKKMSELHITISAWLPRRWNRCGLLLISCNRCCFRFATHYHWLVFI